MDGKPNLATLTAFAHSDKDGCLDAKTATYNRVCGSCIEFGLKNITELREIFTKDNLSKPNIFTLHPLQHC